jgi:amino acid transporter
LLDSTSIIVGIIIGSAIYRASPDIAAGAGRWAEGIAHRLGGPLDGWSSAAAVAAVVGVWLGGGLIALVGAMCFAELATAHPGAGGTYVYLSEAFGRELGFAFAWAEFWIVRPGNVGAIAFVMASYGRQVLDPETPDAAGLELFLAVGAIAAITVLNAMGLRAGTWTQNLLTGLKVLGLAAIVMAAFTLPPASRSMPFPSESWKTLSLSLILVMFAYGGWADVSFVAAEVRAPERNISRALMLGTGAVAVIYLAVTLAFVWVLGIRGVANSEAVAADVMSLWGDRWGGNGTWGSTAISLLVIASCLGAINGTIFTGARVYYALGTHHPVFGWLGAWNRDKGVPLRSLGVQLAATLGLVITFGRAPGSFDRLVVFTTPFYWGFIALVGVALIVLRQRGATSHGTYRVPLYPWTPILFFLTSGAMVCAAVEYALRDRARESWWAVGVVVAGIVVGWLDRCRRRRASVQQAC